jgi:hypothetical protein
MRDSMILSQRRAVKVTKEALKPGHCRKSCFQQQAGRVGNAIANAESRGDATSAFNGIEPIIETVADSGSRGGTARRMARRLNKHLNLWTVRTAAAGSH